MEMEEGAGLKGRTGEARLADLAAAPVQVVTLLADPVAGLLLRRTFVARVDDRGILPTPSAAPSHNPKKCAGEATKERDSR